MSRKYAKYGGILYIWVGVSNTENNFEAYMQSFKKYIIILVSIRIEFVKQESWVWKKMSRSYSQS